MISHVELSSTKSKNTSAKIVDLIDPSASGIEEETPSVVDVIEKIDSEVPTKKVDELKENAMKKAIYKRLKRDCLINANAFYESQDYSEAVIHFKKAIAADEKGCAGAEYGKLSYSLLHLGERTEAVQ